MVPGTDGDTKVDSFQCRKYVCAFGMYAGGLLSLTLGVCSWAAIGVAFIIGLVGVLVDL